MAKLPKPVEHLVERLKRLPGIGEKSAQRIAFHLLKDPQEEVGALADAIRELHEGIVVCSTCGDLTHEDPCSICTDPRRDAAVLCVVEEPADLVTVERTGAYQGRYHVLMGALSPLRGVGPEDLRIDSLLQRIETDGIAEVILATNPNADGDATALYLARLLKPKGVKVSRIAQGLPVGGALEYADEVTMSRAMEGRREM
jgi:recombination protein RecR